MNLSAPRSSETDGAADDPEALTVMLPPGFQGSPTTRGEVTTSGVAVTEVADTGVSVSGVVARVAFDAPTGVVAWAGGGTVGESIPSPSRQATDKAAAIRQRSAANPNRQHVDIAISSSLTKSDLN